MATLTSSLHSQDGSAKAKPAAPAPAAGPESSPAAACAVSERTPSQRLESVIQELRRSAGDGDEYSASTPPYQVLLRVASPGDVETLQSSIVHEYVPRNAQMRTPHRCCATSFLTYSTSAVCTH
ncbi:hypothetical protein N9L68_08145 [bacterium]|nr:hypothetical protein [bacterium]